MEYFGPSVKRKPSDKLSDEKDSKSTRFLKHRRDENDPYESVLLLIFFRAFHINRHADMREPI